MASLIHTKNVSNPAFNLNDTITINCDNQHINSGRTSKPRIETRSRIPFQKKTLQLSLLSNTTSHFYPTPQDEALKLHHVQSAQVSPMMSPKKPYSPLEAIISPKYPTPSPKNMPSLRLVKNKTVSPTFVDRFPVTDAFTMFDTSQTPSKSPAGDVKTKIKFKNLSIGGASEDKFKQYLDYLVKVDASSPKGDFEGRLRDKCRVQVVKKSILNPIDQEVPSLVKLPQTANHGLSAILGPNYLTALNSNEKETERHCSIFKGRKPTLILHRSLSPSSSQHESVITVGEIKNNPVVPQPKEKKFSVRSSRTLNFANSGSRFSKLNEKRDCDQTLRELALNLQELFQVLGKHPVKMADAIDDITGRNQKVVSLLLPKFHKVADYDALKLEQKFSAIEVITEAMSIPTRLQKTREGITLVEQNLIDELGLLNKKMEEYSLVKKNEQLQAVEDRIVQSKEKLHDFQMKLLADIKRGKSPDTFNALRVFLEKDLTLSSNISYDSSPISAVNEYQTKNGDFKLLSKKNLAQAKNVELMFTKWMKQPHEFKP